MNLDRARLALLAAPTTPVWTGTIDLWNVGPFALSVITTSGVYPDDIAGMLLVADGEHLVRIKARSGDTLYLAETPVQFAAVTTVAIYATRLPWPRYQYIDEGVVYKDRDIAFPTPWQREMPPTAILRARLSGNDWGEAIYCATGETIYLDASDSYANLDDGDPLTYAWTPGTGGAITGSGATVTCAYTTTGFRYLKLVVTDAHGTTLNRYLPVWVGGSGAVAAVTSARARWSVNQGWTVELEIAAATAMLQYGQAALIDMETREVLFYGFVVPDSRVISFEITTYSLTLRSALAFSQYVYAYPFLVTAITGVATPTQWAEMYEPTLARALWYLLFWHSTLPEIVNCDLSNAPLRPIFGQEFALGNIPQQVEAVLKSAFWQARGSRAGGFVVNVDPLYLDEDDWAAAVGCDLSAAEDVRGTLRYSAPVPQYSQARLGGVYRAISGSFTPIIVQSPEYPGPWGAPTELNGLAPDDVYEMMRWSVRYITIENTSGAWSVEPGLAVDPAVTWVIDLPNGVRVSIEQANFTFDPAALRWQHDVGGRDYGRGVFNAIGVPLPPPIEYPIPSFPPLDPPFFPPIPPIPVDVPVAVAYGPRVFLTRSLETVPIVWVDFTANLDLAQVYSLVFMGNVLFAAGDEGLYRCADIATETPTWEAVAAPSGYSYGTGEGLRCIPQRRGERLLVNVYGETAECFAWIIDADGDTLTAPFYVGTQVLPATQHLSWYDDDNVLSGHSAAGEGELEFIAWDGNPVPLREPTGAIGLGAGTGASNQAWCVFAIDGVDPLYWYYGLITAFIKIQSYNRSTRYTPNLRAELTFEPGSPLGTGCVYDEGTQTWFDGYQINDIVPHPPLSYAEAEVKAANQLVRVLVPSENWNLRRVPLVTIEAAIGLIYQSQVYEGYIFWRSAGSAPYADPLYAHHLVVPLGYTGDLADLYFDVCNSVTCDDESNCCTLSGDVRHCPAWATMPVIRSYNAGLLGYDGANIIFTPALTPCEDEETGLGTAEISRASQGRNIVAVDAYEIAVSADATELEISADGFDTFAAVEIPAYVGTAFPAIEIMPTGLDAIVLVYGTDGVAGYILGDEVWQNLTGTLTPGTGSGAFATITAGGAYE